VPCKELALKFQRGDILHVINTSDENWWQAYREGDDMFQSLAGLIPSSSFQQQVITYNREMNRSARSNDNNQDLFGCNKKNTAKPKRNNSRKGQEQWKPTDEIVVQTLKEENEILTYEDVALYLSKTGRKRPIVLCGPEGVGCLELRQKLIAQDKEHFASAVPHTTRPRKPGEQDGVHYHFVNKQRFKDDVRLGKFVEWGEYEKHNYGTANASIRSVIESGKTCLLTLKAQSLKTIRNSELMPYVIFVSPPSLQQLKRQRELIGQYNVKDEDLKTVINDGKRLEEEFGHFFDRLIVNVDLDRSLKEVRELLQRVEKEPQWVPAFWLAGNASVARRPPI